MKTLITPEESVKQLNATIGAIYPFIKVVFFATQNEGKADLKKLMITNDNIQIKDLSRKRKKAEFEIDLESTVAAIEKLFAEKGFRAEIFRKAGNSWMTTTTSDHLTLKELNDLGIEYSKPAPELVENETEIDPY